MHQSAMTPEPTKPEARIHGRCTRSCGSLACQEQISRVAVSVKSSNVKTRDRLGIVQAHEGLSRLKLAWHAKILYRTDRALHELLHRALLPDSMLLNTCSSCCWHVSLSTRSAINHERSLFPQSPHAELNATALEF